MVKKFFIAFAFFFIFVGIKQVKAVSVNDRIYPQISYFNMLIDAKVGDVWEPLTLDKVDVAGLSVFKLGNSSANGTDLLIKRKEENSVVTGVIKNGYGNVNASRYGISNEDDFYMATKMAVNCAYLGHEITDDYQKMVGLPYSSMSRANYVMSAAQAIMIKGKAFAKNSTDESLQLVLLSEREEGKSLIRTYKVEIEGVEFNGYRVLVQGDSENIFKIVDSTTKEEKEVFSEVEDTFEVIVENDKSSNIQVTVKAEIHADRLFIGNDNRSDYIVYSEQDEIVSLSDEFEVVYEEETEEKPEGGSGETEESDGTGESTDNSSGGEDNSDNEGNDTDEGENKGDTDTKEPEEDSSKPEGANPNDEETKEELNPGEGESEEKEPDKPKDEILGDTDSDKDSRRRQ